MEDLDAIQADFAISYYHFAVKEWQTELTANLDRLRRFKSPFSDRAVGMFEGLGDAERRDLTAGFLQKGHPIATRRLGVELTPCQIRLREQRESAPIIKEGIVSTGAPISPAIRKSTFAKAIKSRLDFLGDLEPMDSRHSWRYRKAYAPFTVLTYLDVGGRHWDLSYHHDLLLGEIRVCRFVSYLAWLGIGASKWTLQTQGDATQAIELLTELCSHFLSSLGILLPPSRPHA